MNNKRRTKKNTKRSKGIFGRALAQTKLAANVTEEQDWYLDTPDVRLTRIFTVVLILHVVAVGGILAFKMIDKASEESATQVTSATSKPATAVKRETTLAAKAPQNANGSKATTTDAPAKTRPASASKTVPAANKTAAPLRPDPAKSQPEQYRVLAGDSLPEIAKKLGVDADALRKENAIRSDNELYPGRWLNLPGEESDKVAASPKTGNKSTGQGLRFCGWCSGSDKRIHA